MKEIKSFTISKLSLKINLALANVPNKFDTALYCLDKIKKNYIFNDINYFYCITFLYYGNFTLNSRNYKRAIELYLKADQYSKNVEYNFQNENWIVSVSIPISEYRSIISDLQNKIILFGIFVSIALLYISYFISKQITAPIENIRKKTEEYVSTLKMSHPLEIPNTKELASLALSLNKMAKELNKRIKQIQNEKDDKESLLSSMQEGILAINNNKKIISINNIAIDYLNLTKKTLLKEKYTN